MAQGIGLKSADGIKGQLLREWEENFVMLADGDPVTEKELRKMDYYSFLNRIFTMQKKARLEHDSMIHEENRFGRQK